MISPRNQFVIGVVFLILMVIGNAVFGYFAEQPGPTTADIQRHIIAKERPDMGPLEREFWRQAIEAAARKHNVPADVYTAKIAQESHFDNSALSDRGARCAAQIMPMHYKNRDEIRSIESCLNKGAEIFAKELKNCETIERALRCYYSGPTNSQKGTLRRVGPYDLAAYSDAILARVYLAEQQLKQGAKK